MKLTKLLILIFLPAILLWTSCENNDGQGDPCSNNFDQEALFSNIANGIIIPFYTQLQQEVIALKSSSESFANDPNQGNLDQLRVDWKTAYLTWQRVAQFEFGPAEEVQLRSSVNNFPVNTEVVESNIQSGDYDLMAPDTYDKGFPALDYLLYGVGADDAAILAKYTTDPIAAYYKNYLAAVVEDMKGKIDQVSDAWLNGYRETFISNTGTAAGTSLSLLINNFNEHYEIIKRDKIGIPAGVVTLGFTNPDKVEAFYSGLSLELAEESLIAAQQLYLGGAIGGTGDIGLDDFLREIEAMKGGDSLDDLISAQFSTARTALAAIDGPLSAAVDNDKQTVEFAYNELTRQILFIKTDMPSVLCVSITYVDNPSDSD